MRSILFAILLLGASSLAWGEPAAVITDLICGVPTPDGPVQTDMSRNIITYSEAGVIVLKCKVELVEYDSGHWSDAGFPCGVLGPGNVVIVTTDTRVNISTSGQAMLTCKFMEDATP